jgi:hypothetical protein
MDGTDRREFIRSFGVALLAVAGGRLVSGCRRAGEAADTAHPGNASGDDGGSVTSPAPGNAVPPPGPIDAAAPPEAGETEPASNAAGADGEVRGAGGSGPRAQVRALWIALVPAPTEEEWIAMRGGDGSDPRPAREAAHREALDALVAAGELRPPVADLLQVAFVEASFHAWRLRVGATCYDPTQFGWRMQQSRERLCDRARLLDEWARGGTASPELVADARAVLAREIAVYDAAAALAGLENTQRWDRERELAQALDGGGLTPDADELEAAAALVDLLLDAPGER